MRPFLYKICNGPQNTPNRFHMQNLWPQKVGVQTNILKGHIPFTTSTPKVRDFGFYSFYMVGFWNFEKKVVSTSFYGIFVN
jgi:hypothetical protein